MPNIYGNPTEAEEQTALFEWAALMEGRIPALKMLFAIPNGGSRHKMEAINLKRQGLKAGVPDVCLAYPSSGYHGLYIEMKVGKNKPSQVQKQWLSNLSEAGYKSVVCYSFNDAMKTIMDYLRL